MEALTGKLYVIERELRVNSPAERKAARKDRNKPVLDTVKARLDQKVPKVLPKGLRGQAIACTLGLWSQLTTFLDDGSIHLDNNLAENASRPSVEGRKNFLFSGSPGGAQASATLYSLIETAKANTAWCRVPTSPYSSSDCLWRKRPRRSMPSCPRIAKIRMQGDVPQVQYALVSLSIDRVKAFSGLLGAAGQ